MADTKISALTAATDLTGADIPIVQGGANKKAGIALFTPAAIGAEPADATILKSAAIGSTVQAYDADTAKIDVANTWTAAQTMDGGVIITDEVRETPTVANTGTEYTVAITSGTLFDLTLTGNCTFTFPTATAGRQFSLFLKQDGTGSRTATWPSSVRWAAGIAPTLTTTASRTDVVSFIADGTYWLGFLGGLNFTRA